MSKYYLETRDLPDGEKLAVIDSVQSGADLVMRLRGLAKPLIIDHHTVRLLAPSFGYDHSRWQGQTVTLFSDLTGGAPRVGVRAHYQVLRREPDHFPVTHGTEHVRGWPLV